MHAEFEWSQSNGKVEERKHTHTHTPVRKPIWRTHAPIHNLPKIKRALMTAEKKSEERARNSNLWRYAVVVCCCCCCFSLLSTVSILYYIYYCQRRYCRCCCHTVAVIVIVIVSFVFWHSFLLTACCVCARVCLCVFFLNDFFITTYGLHALVQSKSPFKVYYSDHCAINLFSIHVKFKNILMHLHEVFLLH